MKIILFLVFTLFALVALASDECTSYCGSHEAAHESFCGGLSRFSCEAHSSLCYVYRYCPPTRQPQGSCFSYEAAHESFCGGLSRFSCEAHNSFCYWAYQ
jgi:hypothetical protein